MSLVPNAAGTPASVAADGITVPVTGSAALGGVASGATFAPAFSNTSNLDANPTTQGFIFNRVGNVVTVAATFNINPTGTGSTTAFQITLPFTANNFAGDYDASGAGQIQGSSGEAHQAWEVESVTGAQRALITATTVSFTTAKNLRVIFSYLIV